MESWTRDLRHALFRLVRAPAFSVSVLAVFVAVIGLASAMASLARATMEQAAPYRDADQIVRLFEVHPDEDIDDMPSSLPSLRVWTERNRVFSAIGAAHAPLNLTLSTPDGGVRLLGGLVTPSVFDVFAVEPALGRAFTEDEGRIGPASPTAILSHDIWTRRFGADPAAVGSEVVMNGQQWTVIGVLPPDVPLMPTLAERVDVWLPVGQATTVLGRDVSQEPTFRAFPAFARVRTNVSDDRMAQELAGLSASMIELFPGTSQGWSWRTEPLVESVTRDLRDPIRSLSVGALLLLAVGVANVLALFAQRARETSGGAAIRAALGATPPDLRRAATSEAVLLTWTGTLGGLVLAQVALANHDRWIPFPLPPQVRVALAPSVILACVVLALLVAVATGLATGAWWWKRAQAGTIQEARGTGPGARASTGAAIGLQVALASVLSIAAVLTLASIWRLMGADPGVNPDRLLTARVDVPAELRADDAVSATAAEILQAVEAVPGVESAALWAPHVPVEAVWHTAVRILSRPDLQEDGDLPSVRIHQIGPRAATLLGLDFLEGRDFSEDDVTSGRRVAIVSESASREWWGAESGVGRQIRRWNHDAWSTVVGVVRDTPLAGRQGPGADFHRDVMFLHDQDPLRPLVFLARVRAADPGLVRAVTDAIRSSQPDLPAYGIRWMDDILADQERIARSTAALGLIFALTALALVAIGLHGVLVREVSEKGLEISLRKALGASPGRIIREVTGPMWIALAGGVASGSVLAWVAMPRLLGSVLFQVVAQDAGMYVLALVGLAVITIPAVFLPALQGSRRSPAETLREVAS